MSGANTSFLKHLIFTGTLLSLAIGGSSCSSNKPTKPLPTEVSAYHQVAHHSVHFFTEHAYQEELGTFYSEIDQKGQRVSDHIWIVALSRLVYSLAYTSETQPANLAKAQAASQFILDSMVRRDTLGPYFVESMVPGEGPTPKRTLGIWQQSYGLCGLVELYRVTGDDFLLSQIQELFRSYVAHFQDTLHGGFCGSYHFKKGQIEEDKSLQSLMYPITSVVGYLWEADSSHRALYEPYLIAHTKLLSAHGWDEETGWVRLHFTTDWSPISASQGADVMPGHNFQLASVFLRAAQWPFLTEEDRQAYQTLGEQIIDRTLTHPIWDEHPGNGFFEKINASTGEVTSPLKAWWQHAEAIIALSYVQASHPDIYQGLYHFFTQHFVDEENGNEFFHLDDANNPLLEELKGSQGKSAYHTTEMIRFMLQNQVQ